MPTTVATETAIAWTSICPIDQLLPDVGSCALLGDKQVALFYLKDKGSVFAVDNYDPLSGANVLSRGLLGDIKGEIVIASPLYKQHYSLRNGKCLEDDSVSLHTYNVRIHNGMVEVAAPSL